MFFLLFKIRAMDRLIMEIRAVKIKMNYIKEHHNNKSLSIGTNFVEASINDLAVSFGTP